MGISGLLPCLQSITDDAHIQDYAGKTVAVDASVWLHRGSYSCSVELAQDKPTRRYISYCMKRIQLLRDFKVKPIFVFDGAALPAKKVTHDKRAQSREENKKMGLRYLAEGNTAKSMEYFQKCIEITPEMVHALQQELRRVGVEFLVAPYEADAQIAFLARNKYVDFAISEDSDLLPYGCPEVMFKMDKFGKGKRILLERLGSNSNPSLHEFTLEKFRYACIMSGCDYLPSVKQMGFKTAVTMIRKHKHIDRVLRVVKLDRGGLIPQDYERDFHAANLTFLHHRVYDPAKKEMRHLEPLPDSHKADREPMEFLGEPLDPDVMVQIAEGKICPHSKEPYAFKENTEHVSGTKSIQRSYSSPSALSARRGKSAVLPVERHGSITQYFTKMPAGRNRKTAVPPSLLGKRKRQADDEPQRGVRMEMHRSGESESGGREDGEGDSASADVTGVDAPRTPPYPNDNGDSEDAPERSDTMVMGQVDESGNVLAPSSPRTPNKRRLLTSPCRVRSAHHQKIRSRFFAAHDDAADEEESVEMSGSLRDSCSGEPLASAPTECVLSSSCGESSCEPMDVESFNEPAREDKDGSSHRKAKTKQSSLASFLSSYHASTSTSAATQPSAPLLARRASSARTAAGRSVRTRSDAACERNSKMGDVTCNAPLMGEPTTPPDTPPETPSPDLCRPPPVSAPRAGVASPSTPPSTATAASPRTPPDAPLASADVTSTGRARIADATGGPARLTVKRSARKTAFNLSAFAYKRPSGVPT